jgi:hypothetical protein
MNAHQRCATPASRSRSLRLLAACEPTAPWAARALDELVPPATLGDARTRRDELRALLSRERGAAADFLLALADFDRRRGWERLGHASLFAFLTQELGLSSGAAQLRLSAARLLPRHPAVEEALRSGQLCISAVGQLARVLTVENEAEVFPRFLGLSAREAAEVAVSVLPRAEPPRREVVTSMPPVRAATAVVAAPLSRLVESAGGAAPTVPRAAAEEISPCSARLDPADALHTCEGAAPARVAPRTPAIEPLTADLRRLHLTVSKGFLDKVAAARAGLSHALPGATTEQVLEAALDLLLERQAQRKGLGKRTRRAASDGRPLAPPALPAAAHREAGGCPTPASTPAPISTPRRPHVPAALEREVRLRDGDRCQFPLDAGGICGSTWQVELDHVVPLALGGASTSANLRCACRVHNRAAAEKELGPSVMRSARRRGCGVDAR